MAKRIGIHLGTAGGASNAVERAREIGANTFQIFSSSPRMWRAPKVDPKQAARMKELRAKLDVGPLVIHTSYLVNVCSQTDEIREKSVAAFRGEIERALALGRGVSGAASRLVEGAHPRRRPEAGRRLHQPRHRRPCLAGNCRFTSSLKTPPARSSRWAAASSRWPNWSQRLKTHAPVGVCLDTCHTHVAGYDLVSAEGYEETMKQAAATVGSRRRARLALQ